ncbi:MAG: CBS domain-containing protein [Proteobacteria bacterium]|nr:CBS domain-containing protein [Pseudomonadota bacterium]
MSTIHDVLGRKGGTVLTVEGSMSVFDAIKTMSEANIGALVIQDNEQPVGIFTERDYMKKIALKGRSSSTTAVADVMSSPLITVDIGESVQIAMETMTQCRCRHLVVMDKESMAGIISLGDTVKHMLLDKEAEIEQLSSYIAGSY